MLPIIHYEMDPNSAPQESMPIHALTGLYRWWVGRQRLLEEIARADRFDQSFAVVVLEPADLVEEQTPEIYGLAGRALRRAIRIYDFAAQYDDARFVALLPGADREGARAACKRLLAELRSASMPQVRWRGALATYPEDGTTPNELLDRALITLRRGRLESATKLPVA